MKLLLKNKTLTSLITTLLYVIFILPIDKSIWFATNIASRKALVYEQILTLAFGVALFFVVRFVLKFIERIRAGDEFYKQWLRYSLIYGAILAVVFVLIFPGYWSWDEFYILDKSFDFQVYSWQSIFTQIQYIFSIYLFPSSTGITIIQLTTISVITGYVLAHIRRLISDTKLFFITFLPFLTLPVLLSDFYTLRLNIYGYLLLLAAVEVLLLFKGKKPNSNRYTYFIGITFLIALLSFWRSEGIVYLLLLPLFFVKLGIFFDIRNSKKLRPKATLVIIASLLIVITGYGVSGIGDDPQYKLTATIGPLSLLSQNKASISNDKSDWSKINKVLNVRVLSKYPSYTEVPSFWQARKSLIRPNYQRYMKGYYLAYIDLVSKHPMNFMKDRAKTFLATNSMYPSDGYGSVVGNGWLTSYSVNGCKHMPKASCELLTKFDAQSKVNMPINAKLRRDVINFLILQYGPASRTRFLRSFFWNVLPVVVLLIAALIHSVVKRKVGWAIAFLLPLAHVLLIFLTAPAIVFMYYFPDYLCGLVLVVFYVMKQFNKDTVTKRRVQES